MQRNFQVVQLAPLILLDLWVLSDQSGLGVLLVLQLLSLDLLALLVQFESGLLWFAKQIQSISMNENQK
jgi:hypothetical protein